MSYLPPGSATDVGLMVATGIVGAPPLEFVFSAPLRFTAGAAVDTDIAALSGPIAGEAYSIVPNDGHIKWTGSSLKVGAVASAGGLRYYDITRTKGDSTFTQTVTVEVV